MPNNYNREMKNKNISQGYTRREVLEMLVNLFNTDGEFTERDLQFIHIYDEYMNGDIK